MRYTGRYGDSSSLRWMRSWVPDWLPLWLVLSFPLFGQNFDRLTINPLSLNRGTYTPGQIEWCQSNGWPFTTGGEGCMSLSAKELMSRYELILPVEAPLPEWSCLLAPADPETGVYQGQLYWEEAVSANACRAGEVVFSVRHLAFPNGTSAVDTPTQNSPYQARRTTIAPFTGTDPFWWEVFSDFGSSLGYFMFRAVPGLASPPVLHIYWIPSSSVGSNDYQVWVRCVTPNTGIPGEDVVNNFFVNQPFDTANEVTLTSGAVNRMNHVSVVLEDNDDMQTNDLCQIALKQDVTGTEHYIHHMVIK